MSANQIMTHNGESGITMIMSPNLISRHDVIAIQSLARRMEETNCAPNIIVIDEVFDFTQCVDEDATNIHTEGGDMSSFMCTGRIHLVNNELVYVDNTIELH